MIDSGVDPDHPDLVASPLPLIDEVIALGNHDVAQGASFDGRDGHGHGTHVSGLIAAVAGNGIGVAGAAPEAKILPVKVTPMSGETDDATIARGIADAVDAGARVLNLSIGGREPGLTGPQVRARWARRRLGLRFAHQISREAPAFPPWEVREAA